MNHLHRDDKQKIEEIEVPEPERHYTNIRTQVICEPRKSVKELLQLNEARLKERFSFLHTTDKYDIRISSTNYENNSYPTSCFITCRRIFS